MIYYLIDADSESVIYRIVNPKDVPAVADRMREFLPEDITVTGVWQANADVEENLEVSYVEDPVTHEYIVEDDMVYRYKKTLIGKDETAACSVQYIVFTNDAHITWEKVNKSILSSQSTDWLEDTIIIGMTASR